MYIFYYLIFISDMIYLKDLIPEAIAHQTPTEKQVWNGRIPIYPALMKKVIGDVPIESFHITDWYRAKGIKNLIGKKKSLSTFTSLKRKSMQTLGSGIQTSGGIVLHLEGKLLAASWDDLGSVPDLQGRRWFHPDTFNKIMGWKFDENDLHEFVKKNISGWKDLWKQYVDNYREKDDKKYPPLDNKQKQQYIKGWIDGCEKFLLKHKSLIKKKFLEASQGRVKSERYGWNELVIYDIKVKGALIVLDGLAKPGDIETLEQNLKHTEGIIKPYTSNIQRGFLQDDVVRKFIMKHGGKIGSLDPKSIRIRVGKNG